VTAKDRALKKMPELAVRRMDSLLPDPSIEGHLTLELKVGTVQDLLIETEKYPWIGKRDGWPGDKFYCALWHHCPPTEDEVTFRIGMLLGHDFPYVLGAGARDWFSDGVDDRLDCSGGVAWTLMRDRGGHPDFLRPSDGKRWHFSTDSIYYDAKGMERLFGRCDDTRVPFLAVYPDSGGKQGHVAWVTEVLGDGSWIGVDVSYTQSNNTGDATQLHDLGYLRRKVSHRRGLACRPRWWD